MSIDVIAQLYCDRCGAWPVTDTAKLDFGSDRNAVTLVDAVERKAMDLGWKASQGPKGRRDVCPSCVKAAKGGA